MSAASGKKVVIAAFAGNLGIAAAKLLAAVLTGSVAMLSEAVHSLADTGNQALLMVGLRLSERPPSRKHPFGRAGELYFWPFIVAVMLFTVGAVAAFYEGAHRILHPDGAHGGHSVLWNYGVLGFSIILEGFSFAVAYREFRKLANGRSMMAFVREARDPTVVTVLLEDSAAMLGLFVALAGIFLSHVTGNVLWDGVASLAIGVVLAAVALLLSYETHGLLIGESAVPEDEARVREILGSFGAVLGVTQLLTMHIGPQDVILALKLAFPGSLSVEDVERTINEIEREIRNQLPQMKRIFIEPDALGDTASAAIEAA